MCFFFSLIPATFFLTIGYFVFFAASKADGRLKSLGRVLAIWLFVVALFPPITGAYVSLSGLCPIDQLIEDLQKRGGEGG